MGGAGDESRVVADASTHGLTVDCGFLDGVHDASLLLLLSSLALLLLTMGDCLFPASSVNGGRMAAGAGSSGSSTRPLLADCDVVDGQSRC